MFCTKQSIKYIVILSLIGLTSGPASAGPKAAQAHIDLSEPVRAWQKAIEAADLSALDRMHGLATIGFPPDKTILAGVKAIMADYRDLFVHYSVRVGFKDAGWVESPPLVVSWGLYTLTLHPKHGGDDIVKHGRFTDAAVRIDGGWRYIVDHASVPTGR